MKTAFISGVTGQDGSYLAALLLGKGYRVFGGHRRSSSQSLWRLSELGVLGDARFSLVTHDLTDPGSSIRALASAEPDEVYNLGARSFVTVLFGAGGDRAKYRRWVHFTFWKPSESSTRQSAIIRHRQPKCSEKCRPCRKPRILRSIRAAPMDSPSCSRIERP